MAGQSGTGECQREKNALNGDFNTPGTVSSETDREKFSFVSLLLKGDGEMECVQTLTFDQPQHQNASSEQLMGSKFGPVVAVQSEVADVNQIVNGQLNGLYAQPFTSDLSIHQKASTGHPMDSDFRHMVAGHLEPPYAHQQKSGQFRSINAPLFTFAPPQCQEATLGQRFGSDFWPMVARQSQALHIHQQLPGQVSGVNATLVATGKSEALQHHTHNTSPNQHHHEAVIAEKSLFQAGPAEQNYIWSATNGADFTPQLYTHNPYGSTTSTLLVQNREPVRQQNEIQHPRHVMIQGTQMTDHSNGLGTDGMQVDLMPWQHPGLLEQQPNILNQVLPVTRHAKQDKGKGKAVAPQNFGVEGIKDMKLPKARGPFVTSQELSTGTRTKAACVIVEEPKQSHLNKKNCNVHSLERMCRNSQFSCQPAASFHLKISENGQRKCKNVISKIKRRIKEDGHIIVPLIADIWNRDDKSAYKMNFTSICTVDFRNISQCLHNNGFETLYDFIVEVQSMLKGITDDFWFSCEVVDEVNIIHNLFFAYLEREFDDIDFSREKNEVQFCSPKEVKLLSKSRRKLRE